MEIRRIAVSSHLGICTSPVQDCILDLQAGYWKETKVKKKLHKMKLVKEIKEISLQRDEIQKGLMIF